jgi:hypothetical protein
MNRVVSAIGFLLFAAVSLAHFLGFYRILVLLWPGPGVFAAPSLVVTWLGAVGMLVQGLRRNRLWTPFCVVFVYVMLVILAGTRILIREVLNDGRALGQDAPIVETQRRNIALRIYLHVILAAFGLMFCEVHLFRFDRKSGLGCDDMG